MSLFEYSIYLCCVAVLTMLSIVLFSFKANHKIGAFNLVKCDLAISMLFYAVVFSLYLYYGVKYHSIAIPNCYIAPFYCYYAFFFLSLSVRHLLHAPKVQMKKINLLTLPLMFVGTLDFIIYLVANAKGLDYTINAYLRYVHQPIGIWFSYLIYTLCFSGIMWMFFKIVRQEAAFQLGIENFYANEYLITRVQRRYRWSLMLGYVLVFVSIFVDICSSFYEFHIVHALNASPLPHMFYPVMAILVCAILAFFSITIFNSQGAYNRTNEAFNPKAEIASDDSEIENDEFVQSNRESNSVSEKQTGQDLALAAQQSDNDTNIIEQRLRDWEISETRPYLSESLTISKVATDLGVNNRQLSEYLNNTLGINFNTYINQLRINYIKKMLTDNPGLTISELAFNTGFTDASALTKVFKRFTGTTPSKYRTNQQ